MLKNRYGRYMQWHELYPLLGVHGRVLPKSGFATEIQGVWFECAPASGDGRRSKHRVKYFCKCGKMIPFGRAGQHLKACKGDNPARPDPGPDAKMKPFKDAGDMQ